MSKTSTLRPCPFCGGKPVHNKFHALYLNNIQCVKCEITMGGPDYVEKWNRRAPLTAHDFYLRYATIDGVPVPPLSDHALMLFDVYDKIEKVGGELLRRDLMKLPDFLKIKE